MRSSRILIRSVFAQRMYYHHQLLFDKDILRGLLFQEYLGHINTDISTGSQIKLSSSRGMFSLNYPKTGLDSQSCSFHDMVY